MQLLQVVLLLSLVRLLRELLLKVHRLLLLMLLVLQNLVLAGAFDSFNIRREQFFEVNAKGESFIEQLVRYGKAVMTARKTFIEELDAIASGIHRDLTGGRETLSLAYAPSVSPENMEEKLFLGRDIDIRLGSTQTGPHRDDMECLVNGIDVRKFGSQGQQRTAALSLKLAEIELVRQKINDTPVLLLDDVLSELDSDRQERLLGSLAGVQTFLSCTGLDDFIGRAVDVRRK